MLEKISGVMYPILVAGIALGLAWSGIRWLDSLVESDISVRPWVTPQVVVGAAITAIVLMAWVAERLLPLRGMSGADWVHKFRPRGRHQIVDKQSLIQIGGIAVAGYALGLVVGWPWGIAALALAARIVCAAGPRRLPELLRGGVSRALGDATWGIQDSELNSDVFASSWGTWRMRRAPETAVGRKRIVASPATLFLLRVSRRGYLLLIAVIIVGVGVATARVGGPGGVAAFLIAWSILGAALYRCADFSRLGVSTATRWVVLVGHGCVAAGLVMSIWTVAQPAIAVPLIVAGIVGVGRIRGAPRRVDDFTIIDTGVGVTVPPGLLGYYLSGLGAGGGLLLAAAFLAV